MTTADFDDPEPTELLILGLGNVLLSDDGLGVAAVARLEREFELPAGVCAVDGGTLGLALLPLFEGARRAILVDAVRTEDPPGSLVRMTGDEVPPAVRERLSPHQIGVADLLDGARLRARLPQAVTLLGLVPQSLELGVARSPVVERSLPELVTAIVEEARALGWDLPPRPSGAWEGAVDEAWFARALDSFDPIDRRVDARARLFGF